MKTESKMKADPSDVVETVTKVKQAFVFFLLCFYFASPPFVNKCNEIGPLLNYLEMDIFQKRLLILK